MSGEQHMHSNQASTLTGPAGSERIRDLSEVRE